MAKWMALFLILVTVAGAGNQYVLAQGTQAAVPGIDSNLSRQQKINRASLFESSDEQIRIDAAIELILSDDRTSRFIVVNAIRQHDNIAAQISVCKALTQCRGLAIQDKNKDFLEPLFAILIDGSEQQAQAAAEGLVIFEYKVVADRLMRIINEQNYTPTARRNAIYGLKLRPEKQAIFELIRCLSSGDKSIMEEAGLSLQDSIGIPVGTDGTVWQQVVKDLERKSPDDFVRDRLVRQEVKVQQLESRLNSWQGMYLTAMDSMYKALKDNDADKAVFLKQRLSSDELVLQMWALQQVGQWRMSNKALPQSFRPILLSLVSSNQDAVRLETARLLAVTSYFNPAQELLAQLQVEKQDAIQLELLGALGTACNYARVVNPEVKVSDQVYAATLEWAAKFTADASIRKSQKGAEVLGKMIAANGIKNEDVTRYLRAFDNRYRLEKQKPEPDVTLCSSLLNEMATLCGATAHRGQASEMFGYLFTQSLGDARDLIREAAVEGIIKVDEPKAMAICLQKKLADDSSAKIRRSVVELAGRVGGKDDLDWIANKLAGAGESEGAWKAMIEIFKRSHCKVLADWIIKFDEDANLNITAERKATLLEMAEQKADGENNVEIAKAVRKRLATYYAEKGQAEKAGKYYGMLMENASGEDREGLMGELLEAQLRSNQYAAAAQLVANRLIEKDLDCNDVLIKKIDIYMVDNGSVSKQSLLKALGNINAATARVLWREHIKKWKTKLIPDMAEPNQVAAVHSLSS